MEIETYLKIIFCFGIVVLGAYHFVRLYMEMRCDHVWKFLHGEVKQSRMNGRWRYHTVHYYVCNKCGDNKKWSSDYREEKVAKGKAFRLEGSVE